MAVFRPEDDLNSHLRADCLYIRDQLRTQRSVTSMVYLYLTLLYFVPRIHTKIGNVLLVVNTFNA